MKKVLESSEKTSPKIGEIQTNRLERAVQVGANATGTANRLAEKTKSEKPDAKKSGTLAQEDWSGQTENTEKTAPEPLDKAVKEATTIQTEVTKPRGETTATQSQPVDLGSRSHELQSFLGKVTTLEVRKKHVVKSAAFISNKGGVGKTHVATNMAFYMSRLGKKALNIDLDLGNADITNKLAFYCKHTIKDLFNGDQDVDQLIYSTPYGFDLIAGESGNFKLANLTSAHKNRFIKALRKVSGEYDFVLYDLSAGINSTTIDFALAQDYQIIITTPQDIISGYSCIKAAYYRFQEVEKAMARHDPTYKPRRTFRPFIVLNQVGDFSTGRALFDKIVAVSKENIRGVKDFHLDINLLGVIINDPVRIREVELKHLLYSNAFGASKTGQCFHFLSHNLMQYRDPNSMEFKTKFKRFVNLFLKGVDEFRFAQ